MCSLNIGLSVDIGLSVGAARIAGQDRSVWRTLRPSAGQAQQWVSECVQKSKNVTFSSAFSSRYAKTRTAKFRKVVRQHTEGMVVNVIWVLLEIYPAFQQWNNFENPLRIDSYRHEFGVLLFRDTVYRVLQNKISQDENCYISEMPEYFCAKFRSFVWHNTVH